MPERAVRADVSAGEPPTVAGVDVAGYEEEKPGRCLAGPVDTAVTAACALIAAFVLYQVFRPLAQGGQFSLILFLAGVLPLVFLCYPLRAGSPHARPSIPDAVLAGIALLVCLYPVLPIGLGAAGGGGFDAFLDRQGVLAPADVVFGGILLLLVLEACRRTTGLALPVVCLVFLGYGYYGGYLPQSWEIAHAGLDFDQIVNALYNTASGFYGTPLDVCATYIVLFAIYGAVLELSGAGKFFVDLSMSAFGESRTAPGRAVTMSGFLLGTVSGSGTATTVSLGSVAWPILRRAGYPREHAGGMLAAAGIGAILSPPTLGAAAFIIAEYLQVSYLQVLGWALIPTGLYYLAILAAVEIDARRFGTTAVALERKPFWPLLARFGYHLFSLGIIVVFLALGIPPFSAVVYATLVALGLSFLDSEHALTPRRVYAALAGGVRAVLPVAAVCAAAGIITATITRTGIGLQLASLLVRGAQALASDPTAVLVITVLLAAIAVSVLGLAVPVTASFIISWVIIGPAMIMLGISPPETAMFIFYYAVLSEVTPPTALAAVAAAAITGGRVMGTMWQTWKYTLPAFLVPFAFVLTDTGSGLIGAGSAGSIVAATAVSALAVAALAVVTGGWMIRRAGWPERALCLPAALALLYLEPVTIGIGAAFAVAALAVHLFRTRPERMSLP